MIQGKFKLIKIVYHSEGFNIYGVEPLEMIGGNVQLNRYHNATIKTSIDLIEGHTYTLTLEEHQDNYGVYYSILSTAFDFESIEDITPELHLDLLRELTSDRLADNIHEAYPNFINLVLENRVDEIDVNNIYGVGDKLLAKFVDKIKKNCITFMLMASYPDLKLTPKECRMLATHYGDIEVIKNAINENPYDAMLTYTNRGFYNLDDILRDKYARDINRVEWLVRTVIEHNTYEGSTYITTQELVNGVRVYDNNVVDMLVDVVEEADIIQYDKDMDIVQYRPHYEAERKVANFIKGKLSEDNVLDWDWERFKNIKDGVLTEEQQGALKMVCENTLSLLVGHAGCVDCDTEYFNGTEWKRISEYTKGEKVLQYNEDGSANLVEPWVYIKEPCDMMYHFETKYGLNQTVTPDHTMVYRSSKGHLNTKPMQELVNMHNNSKNGFTGKFYTAFNYNGKGIDLTDDEIRVMCAVICDGSFNSNAKEYNDSYKRCRFHIKKDRKKDRLRKLFAQANIPWREHISVAEGYVDFYINAPRREKEFTPFWYDCSNHQLQIICDEIMHWDGTINITPNGVTRARYATTIKANADFIQFAYSACGIRATIHTRDRRGRKRILNGKVYDTHSIEYEVTPTKRVMCGIGVTQPKIPITQVAPKDGYKYCFTVPSHMLVLRRENKIFITGNCGKTSTVKAILSMIEAHNQSYILLAPTGRASQQMANQTGRPAYTIHKATLSILNNPDSQGFTQDWIIIDEMSMVSLDVMQMVINATDDITHTRFLLIGDSGQIPSIGLGAILRDCIKSGKVPTTTLTHCFRFKEGGASYVAECMRQGKPYLPNDCDNYLTLGANQDYTYMQWDGTRKQIVDTYMNAIESGLRPQDLCLLVPYNKGDYGTVVLNNEIQAKINPIDDNDRVLKSKIDNMPIIFHEGDMVLVTKNNYKAIKWADYDDMLFGDGDIDDVAENATGTIYNGQVGVITQMVDDGMVVNIEGESFVFMQNDLINFRLGYALTVHKYQGSQAPYIINVIISPHANMLSRELCYTAQTRFSKKLIEIGDVRAINYALGVAAQDRRKTRLEEFLRDDN